MGNSSNTLFKKFCSCFPENFCINENVLIKEVSDLKEKADKGDANSQFELANMYQLGREEKFCCNLRKGICCNYTVKLVEVDLEKANQYYFKAAENGNIDAIIIVAKIKQQNIATQKWMSICDHNLERENSEKFDT